MKDALAKLPHGRAQLTLTFDEPETKAAEERALQEVAGRVNIQGFRPGKAPPEMVRKQVGEAELLERTVRQLLSGKMEGLVTGNNLRPILPPRVELTSRQPLTVTLTFVERPEVTLKGLEKIKIEKKPVAVEEKDVERMVDYLVREHRTFAEIERAAAHGDQVTMDFVGTDAEGKEVPGTRATGYPVVIGSSQLIPGFEEQLVGMKKGDAKTFTLTFPQEYHAENLRSKPVTFAVTGTKVEQVTTPAFDDAFVRKAELGSSADEARSRMRQSMTQEEESLERRRREAALFDALIKATQVDLAPELVEEEVQGILRELAEGLERQHMRFEDWLQRSGRKPEEVRSQMETEARRRLTLRFGLEQAMEEKQIAVTDEEMKDAVDAAFHAAPPERRRELDERLKSGTGDFEQLRWRRMVGKFVEAMLAA